MAPTVNSQYAGASPVVIDPVTNPTPTPARRHITFAYQTYNATKLHLSFDAPAGWIVDDSASDTYILTQPANEAVPEYTSMITVRVTTVSSQYNASDLAQEVKQMLETIGANGTFSSFSESLTAGTCPHTFGQNGRICQLYCRNHLCAEAAGRVPPPALTKRSTLSISPILVVIRTPMWIRCMINSAQLSRLLNNAVKGRNTHDKAARAESRAVFVRL